MSDESLSIVVQCVSRLRSVPSAPRIETWVRCALRHAQPGEVTVRIVDEAESAALNERYCGRAGATNVLAFPADIALREIDTDAPLGDVVICAPIVEREAVAQLKQSEAHWAHIAVHGALHLIGFDHQTPDEALRMEAAETRIMAALGYPDPYRENA